LSDATAPAGNSEERFKNSPTALLDEAITGVPLANDSRADKQKVSNGPGAKDKSAEAKIEATSSRSAMDIETRALFVHALENAASVQDLPEPFRSLMKTDTVTIRNPNTGKTETVSQDSFNRYMSMTNGEVLKWIIKDD